MNTFDGERIGQGHADEWYPAIGISVVDRNGDRGKDLTVLSGGERQTVEEKFSRTHTGYILIELVQALELPWQHRNAAGWWFKCRADWLHYFACEEDWTPYRLYRIRWEPFRKWLLDEMRVRRFDYHVATTGYGVTLNLLTRTGDVPASILTSYPWPRSTRLATVAEENR